MCLGVEYYENGERVVVLFGRANARLPVRTRNGRVVMVKWGTRTADLGVEDESGPGHIKTWPGGAWAWLGDVRAGKWDKLTPKPVKIIATRFMVLDEQQVQRWFPLPRRCHLQGLLADAGRERRVYVVTVPAPPTYRFWPRIVGAAPPGSLPGS
jgi:hypothetical protein